MEMHPVTTQPGRQKDIDEDVLDLGDDAQDDCQPSKFLADALCYVLPPCWLRSILVVPQQKEAVVLRCGHYAGTLSEPGMTCNNPVGRTIHWVSTQLQSMNLPVRGTSTVLDANGNPLLVAAVVFYRIVNTYRATFKVNNTDQFIRVQADAILKQVIAKYPYEADGDQKSLRVHVRLLSSLEIPSPSCLCCTHLLFQTTHAGTDA
eukprot:m.198698 g.198698  ORF g.198698 m.198698 type:complete len:205 (+) comp14923_c0_seq3:3602-4216(+)